MNNSQPCLAVTATIAKMNKQHLAHRKRIGLFVRSFFKAIVLVGVNPRDAYGAKRSGLIKGGLNEIETASQPSLLLLTCGPLP